MRLNCLLSSFAFVLFFGLIGMFVIPALLIYVLLYPFVKYPQDYFQNIASMIYKTFFMIFPTIDLKPKFLEVLPESAIYISTHQSNLDYPILGCYIKKYLIMTTMKYKKIPFISMIGDLIGVRYLNRSSLDNIADVYNEFEKMLIENRNVIFFAEGTRQDGDKLGKFKKGAFRLAIKTGKPIVPIVLNGSSKVLKKGKFCFSTVKKQQVDVSILSPIDPGAFSTISELLIYTQKVMQEYKDMHKV